MSKINALEVKRELTEKRPKKDELLAVVSGFVRVSFSVVKRGGGVPSLFIDCPTDFVRDYISAIMMELFKVTPKKCDESDGDGLEYSDGERLLRALHIIADGDGFELLGIDKSFSSAVGAYSRGVFLGCGGLSVPSADDASREKSIGYHIEFSFTTESLANDFIALLSSTHNLYAHLMMRGEKYIVYVKDSDDVSDCLALLGADRAVLKMNEAIAAFGVKVNVNRRLNCEMANMTRTVDAAVDVSDAIDYIEKTVGLDALDKKLRAAAEARRLSPSAPISRLADELGISKSGLKHRFDRIVGFAESLKSGKTEGGRE